MVLLMIVIRMVMIRIKIVMIRIRMVVIRIRMVMIIIRMVMIGIMMVMIRIRMAIIVAGGWKGRGDSGDSGELEKWPLQKSNEDLLDLLLLDKKFQLKKIFR